ncbi:hypothetical protein AB0I61_31795 [Polymorphospora rubra]|uniref:hypothetical protein n=1 Tax=Polymorphospora rubra TaxID=338584 RepID=UPI0033C59D20
MVFRSPDADPGRLQKRCMQLPSTMRFTAGQFVPYLRDGIWSRSARRADNLAALPRDRLGAALPHDRHPALTATARRISLTRPDDRPHRLDRPSHRI